MPDNKKHHYVPRFYLKRFSSDPGTKFISLFNHRSDKFIRQANLKFQAYEDYFYGKDGRLESALGDIEGETGEIFKRIIESRGIIKFSPEDRNLIRLYILVQSARTKYAKDASENLYTEFFKKTHKEELDKLGFNEEFKVGLENGMQMALGIAVQQLPILCDLKIKILRNESSAKFLTSDNPVIKYNMFYEKIKWVGSGTGWATIGIQIFLPISPTLMILIYDPVIYRFGKLFSNLLVERNPLEIKKLNGLQYLYSLESLYFDDSIDEYYIRRLIQRYKKFRSSALSQVEESKPVKEESGYSTIVRMHKTEYQIGLTLDFIRYSKVSGKVRIGPTFFNVRNPRLARQVEEEAKNKFKNRDKESSTF